MTESWHKRPMLSETVCVQLGGRNGTPVRGHAILDAVDIALTQHNWHRAANGYAARGLPRTVNEPHQIELLHRRVLGLERGDPRQGDHENGDRLDCRRSNLRVTTPGGNAQNVMQPPGSSAYRGVCWHKGARKWVAYGQGHGIKRVHLGMFTDEQAAATAAANWRAEHLPLAVSGR